MLQMRGHATLGVYGHATVLETGCCRLIVAVSTAAIPLMDALFATAEQDFGVLILRCHIHMQLKTY